MSKPDNQLYFYRAKQLATSKRRAESVSLLSGRYFPLAEVGLEDTVVSANLYAVDSLRTIQAGRSGRPKSYTVYGFAARSTVSDTFLGFTGQHCQPTGVYLLGNGYRAYSPILMRFCSSDGLSPFGKGGINAYAYCSNDPVNFGDPTGRMRWFRWLSNKLGGRRRGTQFGGDSVGTQGGGISEYDKGYSAGHQKGHDSGFISGLEAGAKSDVAFAAGFKQGRESALATVSNPSFAKITIQEAFDNAAEGVRPYQVMGKDEVVNNYLGEVYNLAREGRGLQSKLASRKDLIWQIESINNIRTGAVQVPDWLQLD